MSTFTNSRCSWLAHFFREIDLETERGFIWPEYQVRGCWTDETRLSPNYMLRHALRIGRLYATWACRGGRPTVVGSRPVVSFFEFNGDALNSVLATQRVADPHSAPYAIVVPLEGARRMGAKPTICIDTDGHARSGLPIFDAAEQYRIPPLRDDPPSAIRGVEWRWPLNEPQWAGSGPFDCPNTSYDILGLDLHDHRLQGQGVIVGKQSEIRPVLYDILTKVDRRDVLPTHFKFVATFSDFKHRTKKQEPGRGFAEVIAERSVSLGEFFDTPIVTVKRVLRELNDLMRDIELNAPPPQEGEYGGCWLWIIDNFHPLTRALVKAGALKVNDAGKYLVRLPGWDGYSLRQREHMTQELARRVEVTYRVKCTYFSVFNDDHPDARPTYYGVLDHELYFNR
jgi:hypothetical protein